jgi:hypothetical protein
MDVRFGKKLKSFSTTILHIFNEAGDECLQPVVAEFYYDHLFFQIYFNDSKVNHL